MKRWFFAVGIIITVTGLVAAAMAYSPREAKNYPRIVMVKNEWSVTANLTKGQFVWVDLRQGINWSRGLFDIGDEPYQGFGILYVGVNITSPEGNLTMFRILYGQYEDNPYTLVPVLDINVTTNYGAVDPTPLYKNTTNSYWDVGGIAQSSGTYTFTVCNIWPNRDDPPSTIDIRERTTVTEYPYTYLLPTGITTSAGGATLTWFSAKRKSKTKLQRKRV